MVKWEYTRVIIQWGLPTNSTEKRRKWFANSAEGNTLEGFENVLSYFGQQGWEAFSANPSVFDEVSSEVGTSTKKSYDASTFTVLFKRPVNDA